MNGALTWPRNRRTQKELADILNTPDDTERALKIFSPSLPGVGLRKNLESGETLAEDELLALCLSAGWPNQRLEVKLWHTTGGGPSGTSWSHIKSTTLYEAQTDQAPRQDTAQPTKHTAPTSGVWAAIERAFDRFAEDPEGWSQTFNTCAPLLANGADKLVSGFVGGVATGLREARRRVPLESERQQPVILTPEVLQELRMLPTPQKALT